MRTIAIVGNGASLIGSGLGTAIDACDDVLRFNLCRMDPRYHADAGSRVTMWVTYRPEWEVPAETVHTVITLWYGIEHVGADVAEEKCAHVDEIVRMHEAAGRRVLVVPRRIPVEVAREMGLNPSRLWQRKPTVGPVIIAFVAEVFSHCRVLIAGFDQYADGREHYYRPQGSDSMRRKVRRLHDLAAERAYINNLMLAGTVCPLRTSPRTGE